MERTLQTTPSPVGLAPAAAAKTPRQILVEVRELIGTPERWTQGDYARAANGNPIGPATPGACRWCLLGAISRVSGQGAEWFYKSSPSVGKDAAIALEKAIDGCVYDFNDCSSHLEVLAALDKAIASLPEGA